MHNACTLSASPVIWNTILINFHYWMLMQAEKFRLQFELHAIENIGLINCLDCSEHGTAFK